MVDTLVRAATRLALPQRPPLMYSNDDWQRLVQDYRAELEPHYAFLLNDAQIAQAVIEKDRFHALAAARGLPIPRTLTWEDLEGYPGPVLVKPLTKFHWAASAVATRLFAHIGKAAVYPDGPALGTDAAGEAPARAAADSAVRGELDLGGWLGSLAGTTRCARSSRGPTRCRFAASSSTP